MSKLRLLSGGKGTEVVVTRARAAPAVPRRVSAAAGAIECLDMMAREREVPADADERLEWLVLRDAHDLQRAKLKARVRVAIERYRIARPRLRLGHVQRFTPGVQAHIEELARRHARELVLRVRAGGADDFSVPIEVEVILEICSWFEVLGKLKSEAGVYGQ